MFGHVFSPCKLLCGFFSLSLVCEPATASRPLVLPSVLTLVAFCLPSRADRHLCTFLSKLCQLFFLLPPSSSNTWFCLATSLHSWPTSGTLVSFGCVFNFNFFIDDFKLIIIINATAANNNIKFKVDFGLIEKEFSLSQSLLSSSSSYHRFFHIHISTFLCNICNQKNNLSTIILSLSTVTNFLFTLQVSLTTLRIKIKKFIQTFLILPWLVLIFHQVFIISVY